MKKKFNTIILIVFSIMSSAQVGIGTSTPKATLDVTGKPTDINAIDGILPPRMTGNELKTKDALYGADQIGSIVYATVAANPTSEKTKNIIGAGYYYFDGSVWNVFNGSVGQQVNNTTRYLGGTVYVIYSQQSGGNVSSSRVIGGNVSPNYSVGSSNQTSSKGGIESVIGNGYTVSNPKNGIFDIKFDNPLTQIYGVSVNIVDGYGYNNGNQSNSSFTGMTSIPTEPGTKLYTNDNSHVSYISNSIIRIKTGNSNGYFFNRSFTFLVTGL